MKRYQWISTINLIIAIVLLNIVLGYYQFWRVDLTSNKIHSLSASTKKIVRELPDLVNIKVFLTQDLPPEARVVATNLKTILEEIGRLNRNKLTVSYVDPNKDENGKQEAQTLGIQPLQFSTVKSDKFEIQTGYFGLALIYGDRQEVLPVAGDTGNLEYFLMSAIKKLINPTTPTVAIRDNNGTGTEILRAVLGKTYKLAEEKEAGVLVMVGIGGKIDNKKMNELRNQLSNGQGWIVLADKMEIGNGLSMTKVENKELEQLLGEYGIEIESKLVMDQSSVIASFRGQNGTFLTKYPYWITVRTENVNTEIPVMSGLNSLMLPWASPLKVVNGAKTLFSSSQESVVSDGSNLTPGATFPEEPEAKKEILGAINTDKVKLAVIGDSDLIKDQFVVNSQQNMSLLLNLIDYFSSENDLMEIRTKEVNPSLLRTTDDNTRTIVKWANLAAPIIILVLSLVVFKIRRKNANKKFGSNN